MSREWSLVKFDFFLLSDVHLPVTVFTLSRHESMRCILKYGTAYNSEKCRGQFAAFVYNKYKEILLNLVSYLIM